MPPPGVSLQLGATHLEDALQISRFQATLRFALQTKGNAIIQRWIADGAVRDTVSVDHETTIERIPITPDAVFTLRLLGEPEGCNRIHVFLDADRGTMTTKRFIVKMRGYWHYWRSGQQEERFGSKNFRESVCWRRPVSSASWSGKIRNWGPVAEVVLKPEPTTEGLNAPS